MFILSNLTNLIDVNYMLYVAAVFFNPCNPVVLEIFINSSVGFCFGLGFSLPRQAIMTPSLHNKIVQSSVSRQRKENCKEARIVKKVEGK